MTSPSVLAVGDLFIPGSEYADVIHDRLGERVRCTVTELGGSKRDQHANQQLMEEFGPNEVEIDATLSGMMADHEFVIVHFAPVPRSVFAKNSATRAVFAARTGVENVDVAAATAAGAGVFNVVGRNASGVAELALGLMLSEARNIARADRSVKDGGWKKSFSTIPIEVGGSTIGLVGFGRVGQELAKRLTGFGVRLLVADPFVSDKDIDAVGGTRATLETVFTQSDFVSVQARLNRSTERMVNRELISAMKPSAYFINVGRSRLVDTEALFDALDSGRIAGAGLDVFDEEPLSADSPWRELGNLTITTHFGGDTRTTNRRSAELVAECIEEFLDGTGAAQALNAVGLGWDQ